MQIGGYVTDATQAGRPVGGATVILVEQGLDAKTDAEGRFSLKRVVSSPQCTFLVVAPGYETTRKVQSIPAGSYDIEMQPESEAVPAR